MNILKNIIECGLLPTDQYQKKRGIILSNSISLVLCIALILLLCFRTLVTHNVTVPIFFNTFLVGVIVLAIPILLNKLYFNIASRIVVCLIPLFFIWYAHIINMRLLSVIETSMYDSIRIYLLAMSPLPYLLFNKTKPWSMFITILPTLLSFLFFEQILHLFGVGFAEKGSGGIDYQLMYIRGLVAYVVISGVCYAFQTIITNNDELNQKMMAELKSQTEEIEAQNEALVLGQNKLNELYLNLESLVDMKTAAIQMQNEKIVKYTFANSHLVRASVARILGLVHLSTIDKSDHAIFFEKIAQETIELNEITKTITKDLEMMD